VKFFRFLISRTFLINFVILAILLIVLFIILQTSIKRYTHHGESLTVPEFKGMTIEQVDEVCKNKELQYKITDSIFIPDVPYFTVIEQTPDALSKVKVNRTIYLTISSDKPPKVKLPNIIDVTLRQAVVMIQNAGLKIGELTYKVTPEKILNPKE